jgi:hypothetical protein
MQRPRNHLEGSVEDEATAKPDAENLGLSIFSFNQRFHQSDSKLWPSSHQIKSAHPDSDLFNAILHRK